MEFGEIVLESSRAWADDEHEFNDISNTELQIGLTAEGENFVGLSKTFVGKLNLFLFVGKVASGFGELLLKRKEGEEVDKCVLLSNIYSRQKEGTVDTLLLRPQKPVLQIFFHSNSLFASAPTLTQTNSNFDYSTTTAGGTLFVFSETNNLPLSTINHIAIKGLGPFIKLSEKITIFQSETQSVFDERVYFIKSSLALPSSEINEKENENEKMKNFLLPLPPPKFVSGLSASVLNLIENVGKRGILLISYLDSNDINSITLSPFTNLFNSFSNKKIESDDKSSSGYYKELNYYLLDSLTLLKISTNADGKFNIDRLIKYNNSNQSFSETNLYI